MKFITESNRIYYEKDGKTLAEITFRETEPKVYTIDHTFVDGSLRGQGIADKLVRLAVGEIRGRGAAVTATCSYAQHWLEKNDI